MTWEYKCVAGPTVVSIKKAKDRADSVKAFEAIMNREAADEWEYVGMDEFQTSEPESWLSKRRIYTSSKMLVFRRAKAGAGAGAAAAAVLPAPLQRPVMESAHDVDKTPTTKADPKEPAPTDTEDAAKEPNAPLLIATR